MIKLVRVVRLLASLSLDLMAIHKLQKEDFVVFDILDPYCLSLG